MRGYLCCGTLLAASALLLVGCPPEASFEANPTEGEAPLEVEFDASDSHSPDGEIVNYRWDFGDGHGEYGENAVVVEHTYEEPGEYTAELTVMNEQRGRDSAAETIEVWAHDIGCDNPYHPDLLLYINTEEQIPYGASLPLMMVATTSWNDFEMTFPYQPYHRFTIYTTEGEEVWSYPEEVLPAGTSATYTHDEGALYFERFHTPSDWDALEPGEEYILQGGLLASEPGPAYVCTRFQVIEGKRKPAQQ